MEIIYKCLRQIILGADKHWFKASYVTEWKWQEMLCCDSVFRSARSLTDFGWRLSVCLGEVVPEAWSSQRSPLVPPSLILRAEIQYELWGGLQHGGIFNVFGILPPFDSGLHRGRLEAQKREKHVNQGRCCYVLCTFCFLFFLSGKEMHSTFQMHTIDFPVRQDFISFAEKKKIEASREVFAHP